MYHFPSQLGQLRMYWFFLKNNFLYKLSGFKAEQTKLTEVLRDYTHTTIREIRKRLIEKKDMKVLDDVENVKKVRSFAEIMLEENVMGDEELAKQIMSIIIAGESASTPGHGP